jgi:hypothetical protein
MSADQIRKTSLTLEDLETLHAMRQSHMEGSANENSSSATYHENHEIFEDICQQVETDLFSYGNSTPPSQRRRRRLSLQTNSCDSVDSRPHHRRRHSTFHSQNLQEHWEAHVMLKNSLEEKKKDINDERRTSFVQNLMEFNMSYSVVMTTSTTKDTAVVHRGTMSTSCPVLNYLNDDDEDSVELRRAKRSSLPSLLESKTTLDWENLEDASGDNISSDEYFLDMPPMEEELILPRKGKRRKPHSYQMLERRLSVESPVSVMKSFTIKEMTNSCPSYSVGLSTPSKDLNILTSGIIPTFPVQRVQNSAPGRQQCARGA